MIVCLVDITILCCLVGFMLTDTHTYMHPHAYTLADATSSVRSAERDSRVSRGLVTGRMGKLLL